MEKLYGLSYEVKELRSKRKVEGNIEKNYKEYKQRLSTKN